MTKKTETIEIRVSREMKSDLTAMCEHRGEPVSQVLRTLVARELTAQTSGAKGPADMATSQMNTLKKITASAFAVTALAVGWNVMTQPSVMAQADVRATFAMLDVNDDGVVTADEFAQAETRQRMEAEAEFEADVAIANRLSKTCQAELKRAELANGLDFDEGDFKNADANNDGKIGFNELLIAYTVTRKEEFSFLDQDKDGFLTKSEFLAEPETGFEEDGGPVLSESCETELEAAMNASEPFSEAQSELRVIWAILDANRDNRISFQEFLEN